MLGFGLPTVWAGDWISTVVGETLVFVGTLLVAAGFLAGRYRARSSA